jgi:hypothetical protein
MSEYDPTDIIENEKREADAKAENKRLVDQDVEDLKWLMSDKRGRRFIWRLLAITGVFRNPFRGTRETDFRCGEMNIGQIYLGDLNLHTPSQYNEMVMEHLNNGK